MIKLFFTTAFFLAVSCCAFSQGSEGGVPQQKLLARFNFLGIADVLDENFCVGLEYRFHPNWAMGTDVGWIFFSRYIAQNKGANGILARPFIRYYPRKNGGGFIEAELHYKYVSYKIENWVGREPVNNIPAYEEFTTFHYKKNAAGIHIKGGFQLDLGRDGKFKFEFTGGVGVRWKWQGVKDAIYTRQTGLIGGELSSPKYFGAVVPMNMRLLYVLK